MSKSLLAIPFAAAAALVLPAAAQASSAAEFDIGSEGGSGGELQPYLQCVPYARQLSGIQIYGDAHSWWDQASGRYQRGQQPRVGAVMAFQPYQGMVLGHVAAVSKVIDSRTVLLSHSNWSPINGRRGQIENNVQAVDVSPQNDWSQVRVWYGPMQALGTTAWPVHGFIYPDRDNGRLKSALPAARIAEVAKPAAKPGKSSRAFTKAFAGLATQAVTAPSRSAMKSAPAARKHTAQNSAADPVSAAIALYEG